MLNEKSYRTANNVHKIAGKHHYYQNLKNGLTFKSSKRMWTDITTAENNKGSTLETEHDVFQVYLLFF